MFGTFLVKISEWVFKMVKANLAWGVLTLMGGGVFGFFPATIALARLLRQWQLAGVEPDVFSFMWTEYRQHFKIGNQLGVVYFSSLMIILFNMRIASHFNHLAFSIASFMLLFALVLWLTSLTYLFPLVSHYEKTVFEYIKLTIVLAFYDIRLLVIQLMGVAVIWYLTLEVSALVLFGTTALWQLYTNRCCGNLFRRIEQRDNQRDLSEVGIL